MRIGLIEKAPAHTKTAYWFMALGMSKEVTEIYINIDMMDKYKFFPLQHPNVSIKPIGDIESDSSLDFAMYGWEYIRRGGLPNSVVPCGVIFGGAKRWSFGGQGKKVIDASDLVFKYTLATDMDVYKNSSKRPKRFANENFNLTNNQIAKLRPLMFIGACSINDYPGRKPLSSCNILVSFHGKPTSLNRYKTVKIVKSHYGKKFVGGFTGDNLATADEWGNNLKKMNLDISAWKVTPLPRRDHLELMANTVVNLSPSGLGNSTHRFVDTLCMGGFCLTTSLEGLNYGSFAPLDGTHYISYKEDCSDLIEKIKYYNKHRRKTRQLRKEAGEFMDRTYLQPAKMAREYIIKEFTS
jgi:hypothetical protein